jgi:hypothetical protein
MKITRSILLSFILLVVFTRVNAQSAAINKVLTSYLQVKGALFADNSKGAATRAKTLSADVKAVSTQTLSATEKTAWAAVSDKLTTDSKHISESTSIDHQREHFATLSANLLSVLKGTQANATTVYVQYCPMKKASWLSDAKDIENPYYGSEMGSCGSVKETFKASK